MGKIPSADRIQSKLASFPISRIHIGDRKRELEPQTVQSLVESIREIGLLSPIVIRLEEVEFDDGKRGRAPILVAGLHRLKALEALGRVIIPCKVLDCGELDARLCEISENLHRADLTVQKRSDQTAEWVRLVEQKTKGGQLAHPSGGEQPHEKGVSKAARELGTTPREVRRAIKIASITPEAKQAAKEAKLDDNQRSLLNVASVPPEKQIEKVQEIAAEKQDKAAAKKAELPSEPSAVARKAARKVAQEIARSGQREIPGPASTGELKRLHARNEELENQKRRLEIENIGLRSEVEEVKAARAPTLAPDGKGRLHCSFCGKGQKDVSVLVAGPKVFICDECVDLCVKLVDEKDTAKQQSETGGAAMESQNGGQQR